MTIRIHWRRIGSDALLLAGLSLLLGAAIALRVALVTNPILDPELAVGASLAFGAVGIPTVLFAAHVGASAPAH